MQATLILPADLLIRHTATTETTPALILVTGEHGSGKTTWCLELAREARSAGMEPAGLVSPAVFEQGVKTGIDLIQIATGERRHLAAIRRHAPSDSGVRPDSPRRHWSFDPETLAWGNQVMKALQPGKLLILDELGPLELLENSGFTAGIEQIQRRNFALTCVVVRPSLLQNALERWPWAQKLQLHLPGQPARGERQ